MVKGLESAMADAGGVTRYHIDGCLGEVKSNLRAPFPNF